MRRLYRYLSLTFLITWVLWWGTVILVKYTAMQEHDWLPMLLFTAGGFGPAVAAFCCMEKKRTVKELTRFLFQCGKGSVFVLVILIALEAAAFGLSSMERNPAIRSAEIPLILLQAVFLYGGNEEPGWRGVMQPLLQENLPYPLATLVVGAVWALWHLPLWFIEGNSHQGSSFAVFALLAVLLSFWLSALMNCRGSVFWCMILHGVSNILLSVFVIKFNIGLVSGLVLITAVSVFFSINGTRAVRNGAGK